MYYVLSRIQIILSGNLDILEFEPWLRLGLEDSFSDSRLRHFRVRGRCFMQRSNRWRGCFLHYVIEGLYGGFLHLLMWRNP